MSWRRSLCVATVVWCVSSAACGSSRTPMDLGAGGASAPGAHRETSGGSPGSASIDNGVSGAASASSSTPDASTASALPGADTAATARTPVMETTAPARSAPLAAGDAVPAFRALAHDGREIRVGPGPRERILVVYFYPRDATPG